VSESSPRMLRRAAALALVGWYLMVPPLTSRTGPIKRDSPLSKWETWFAFDTANECQTRSLSEK